MRLGPYDWILSSGSGLKWYDPLLVVVQLLSCVWLFATPWTAARQACLSFTISQSLLKLKSTESMMPSNHLILCRPYLLLPSTFPSIMVFSNEYSGLISLGYWLDILVVRGTLKSLLQQHCSKASILWHSVFFMVQLLHLYMSTGKTIALTIWIFVGEEMSLVFKMLCRFIGSSKMVGWYHWLNGHEFEQTLADSEGQGSLVCWSSWGCKELDIT